MEKRFTTLQTEMIQLFLIYMYMISKMELKRKLI